MHESNRILCFNLRVRMVSSLAAPKNTNDHSLYSLSIKLLICYFQILYAQKKHWINECMDTYCLCSDIKYVGKQQLFTQKQEQAANIAAT